MEEQVEQTPFKMKFIVDGVTFLTKPTTCTKKQKEELIELYKENINTISFWSFETEDGETVFLNKEMVNKTILMIL